MSGVGWKMQCLPENESLEGFRSLAMEEKIRSVSQDSDCSDWDSDAASVRTLNAFVNSVALKKDKRMWGLTQSD